MTDKKQKVHLPESPFPGIDPFNYAERNVFFARDQEGRSLVRLVVIHRGVLLYADSGTGKSSLINAGLLPHAISEGLQPERLRVQPRQHEEIIVERLSESARSGPPFLPSIFSSDEEEERMVLSVDDFLATIRKKAPSARPLLIFDQFEEWFTLFEEGARGKNAEAALTAKNAIRDAILSLLRDTQLPVKVLLVLREDYLAKLTPFFKRYPNLPDQYLRLTHLKGTDIKHIIRGPFEEYAGTYAPEIPAALAQKIRKQFEGRSGGEPVRLSEVQIVCRTLYESGKAADELEAYFTEQGGVQGILEEYLRLALESLPKNQRDPAIGLLSRMVTAAGTRNVISGEDVISRVENEDNISRNILSKTLDSLEQQTKLVRRERRREVYYYEIASEFLVEWVRAKARERAERIRLEEKERALLEEKKKAEEQARIASKLRKRAVALVVALAIVVLAAGLAGLAYLNTYLAQSQAMESELDAKKGQEKALNAQLNAEKAKRDAIRAKQLTATERKKTVALSLATESLKLNELYAADSDTTREDILAALLALEAFRFDSAAINAPGIKDVPQVGYFPEQIYEALLKTSSLFDPSIIESQVKPHDWIESVAFGGSNGLLAVSSADGRVGQLKIPVAQQESIPTRYNARVRAVAFNPIAKETMVFGGEGAKLVLSKKDSVMNTIPFNHQIWCIAFSPKGDKLAIGSASDTVFIYDPKLSPLDTLSAPSKGTHSLSFSGDGKLLAASGLDDTVRIWYDNKNNQFKASPESRLAIDEVRTIAFKHYDKQGHNDADTLLVGDKKGFLRLLSLKTDNRDTSTIRTWRGHNKRVTSVAFSSKKPWLAASGSADETAKIWDLRDLIKDSTKKIPKPIVLRGHNSWVWSVAFTSNGDSIATSGSDGSVRIWATSQRTLAPWLLQELKQRKPNPALSEDEWTRFVGSDFPHPQTPESTKGGGDAQKDFIQKALRGSGLIDSLISRFDRLSRDPGQETNCDSLPKDFGTATPEIDSLIIVCINDLVEEITRIDSSITGKDLSEEITRIDSSITGKNLSKEITRIDTCIDNLSKEITRIDNSITDIDSLSKDLGEKITGIDSGLLEIAIPLNLKILKIQKLILRQKINMRKADWRYKLANTLDQYLPWN